MIPADTEGPDSSTGSFSNYIRRSSFAGSAAALSNKRRVDRRPSATADNAKDAKAIGGRFKQTGDAKRRKMRWIVIAACVGVILLSAASMIGWAMSYRAGVASVESTGLQLQEIYPQRAMYEHLSL